MASNMKVGWLGTGRMGFDMATRVAKGGVDLTVYNRTRAKAEPLAQHGAKIVDRASEVAACDVVFVMLATYADVKEVVLGPNGLLSGADKPRVRTVVECSSISQEGSAELRKLLGERGIALLAAPVSGNPKVIKAGRLSIVCSGPRSAYDTALPYLKMIGPTASYVGEGELARIAKICHNVMLGVVIQNLAEIVVLAEKAGMPRHAFLEFLNGSVMGSTFTRYKTPQLVNLDMHVTLTPELLRKDLDLGLDAARRLNVPMPLASITRDMIQTLIGNGFSDQDFAALLLLTARASGVELKPENVPVGDGLS
jgi:3-hydroxyisobutyrate dehydrogenase-like beta-hydroxyacid dehydrogenase